MVSSQSRKKNVYPGIVFSEAMYVKETDEPPARNATSTFRLSYANYKQREEGT